MESYEATNKVFSRIKSIEPENASKIMGYILIQDFEEKDLMRLAYGPDTLLHSLIMRAKIQLGLSSNTSSSTPSTPASPSPLNPIARPSNSNNPFSQSSQSPRLISNGGAFDFKNPSSPSSNSSAWPLSGFSNYPAINRSAPLPFGGGDGELIDEDQLNEYLSFLNGTEDFPVDPRMEFSHNGDAHFLHHRRSFSASDASFGMEDAAGIGGFKPCLYFARGFCKNGSNCKFVHGGFGESADAGSVLVGSPSGSFDGFEQHEEMMRLKAAHHHQQQQQQQHRLAAASQLMSGMSPSVYNKYMNFLLQQQNDPQRAAAAAALMMGEELYKFGRSRPERNEFLSMASAEKMNSASRQIYLTFPAESTFKDEDVSEYFK